MDKHEIFQRIYNIAISPPSGYDNAGLALFSIGNSLKCVNMLELGVRGGGTTLPLLFAAYLNGGKLTSIDIEDHGFNCPELIAGSWTFIKQDAIKFLTELPEDTKYDFVFVDDWHSYEQVKKEIELIKPHITSSTTIVLHDSMYFNYQPYYHVDMNDTGEFANGGPARAILELDRDEWEWCTLPFSHGLTFLRYHNKLIR